MKSLIVFVLLSLCMSLPAVAKTTKAGKTHHAIHATARPYRAVGHFVKTVSSGIFEVVDATIFDPVGVKLQMIADGLDMGIAAPLEKLPEPFETLGDGVHYVYVAVDAFGTQLAK